MDYSPPSSSGHWIFQARILKWVAIPYSRGSSQPRDWSLVFGRQILYLRNLPLSCKLPALQLIWLRVYTYMTDSTWNNILHVCGTYPSADLAPNSPISLLLPQHSELHKWCYEWRCLLPYLQKKFIHWSPNPLGVWRYLDKWPAGDNQI